MYNLKIITATVRPSRKGPIVTEWVAEKARQHGEFNVEILDLQAINLPLMNEPYHPAQQKYEHEHTKQWSAQIASADAFIFVTAEYNFSYPAPLQNALEYLVKEWGYKAAGIASATAEYPLAPGPGMRSKTTSPRTAWCRWWRPLTSLFSPNSFKMTT